MNDLIDTTNTNLKLGRCRNGDTIIHDISQYLCQDSAEVFELIDIGNQNRAVASNNMNLKSSRSHTIMTITIVMTNRRDGTSKDGKLQLVDLAGSERIDKTGAQGLKLSESKCINQSLSALDRVINAFNNHQVCHIPYRESKLTHILADSFGGNSKTCMIVTVSPHQQNRYETLSTLRFGSRAQKVKNTPKVNINHAMQDL